MDQFLLTLAAGFVIGAVFFKLKVPGGMMVGAIVGAAIFNISTGHGYMPDMAQQIAKITAGPLSGVQWSGKILPSFAISTNHSPR